MPYAVILLVVLTGSTAFEQAVEGNPATVRPENEIRPLYTRVRSDDQYLIALIRRGYERSVAFRELVDRIQQSNVIVFVQPGLCAGGRIRSCLVGVAGSPHDRHIRIRLDPQHTIENGLIAAVAHELTHAVEVADRPDVVDSASLLALYRGIATGRCGQGLSEECETTRALTIERTVYLELQHGASRPAVSKK
jgi:hypothetical protein